MKQIVYVSSPVSQEIHIWQLNNAGSLTLLQILDVPGQGQPMAIHPNKPYLYVGVRPLFSIISYRIQANGTLRLARIAPLLSSPSYISTDLLGRYLFSASYTGNCVSVSQIDDNGVVTERIKQIDGLITPHSANIDPTNQRLFVPCLKEDCIRLFNFHLDGQLTKHVPQSVNTAAGAGPRHMAFFPNGKYAYCVNELDGTVDVLTILKNSSQYRVIQTLDIMPVGFSGTPWAADIHLTPNARFLYISERAANILTIFHIAEDGSSLSVVGHHVTDKNPRGFNIDHSGRFVIAACQQSGRIVVNKINQESGGLSTLASYPVGKDPVWVSMLAQ
ncbi:6-phosphogluconolactonase [Serratia symbiotica]|nr:6-phosphogluconolactonase [Serratia symbiotica]